MHPGQPGEIFYNDQGHRNFTSPMRHQQPHRIMNGVLPQAPTQNPVHYNGLFAPQHLHQQHQPEGEYQQATWGDTFFRDAPAIVPKKNMFTKGGEQGQGVQVLRPSSEWSENFMRATFDIPEVKAAHVPPHEELVIWPRCEDLDKNLDDLEPSGDVEGCAVELEELKEAMEKSSSRFDWSTYDPRTHKGFAFGEFPMNLE